MAVVELMPLGLLQRCQIQRRAGDGKKIRDFGPPAGLFEPFGSLGRSKQKHKPDGLLPCSKPDILDHNRATAVRAICGDMAVFEGVKGDGQIGG